MGVVARQGGVVRRGKMQAWAVVAGSVTGEGSRCDAAREAQRVGALLELAGGVSRSSHRLEAKAGWRCPHHACIDVMRQGSQACLEIREASYIYRTSKHRSCLPLLRAMLVGYPIAARNRARVHDGKQSREKVICT